MAMKSETVNKPAASRQKPAGRVSKRGRISEGRPSKASAERIASILKDLARGFTVEQACAGNGTSHDQFEEWQKRPEFPVLRAAAQYARIDWLLSRIEDAKGFVGWQRYTWLLEHLKVYRDQFSDPKAALSVHLNQQINNNSLTWSPAELNEARQRLDETKLEQARRRLDETKAVELKRKHEEILAVTS